MRRGHATEYHAEGEATQNARAPSNWTIEEKELLARAEANLVFEGTHKPTMINIQLSRIVGARSLQAIKGRRRCPDHKERVAQHLEVMGQGRAEDPRGEARAEARHGRSREATLVPARDALHG